MCESIKSRLVLQSIFEETCLDNPNSTNNILQTQEFFDMKETFLKKLEYQLGKMSYSLLKFELEEADGDSNKDAVFDCPLLQAQEKNEIKALHLQKYRKVLHEKCLFYQEQNLFLTNKILNIMSEQKLNGSLEENQILTQKEELYDILNRINKLQSEAVKEYKKIYTLLICLQHPNNKLLGLNYY